MKTEDAGQGTGKKFKTLLAKRKKLSRQIKAIEKDMFRHETVYLEMTQGSPLTRNVDYYVSNRTEKKKHSVDDKMRMFSRGFPRTDQ
ncbi:ECU11_0585 [Encephalitozoon cuniculi GB-M1]|uniref:Chromatin modification-related protein EAF6 n=1 Tax=Encephalitozoon cuniculi (strain GB-M1) TaxID=284813 RepID=I7L4K0_ENCCU|nr:uncharacterized protein ECU11_0585 [Encephalitozoon cuniculi GB-M1]UYI26260.1 hypothetical protein J0A71_01g00770 [Encephalitozoon cuniculi]CCI73995.1 ECU11_0585 [Encephalitozoon cuniculi GB-M1]